jgi:hypothetical protein
MKMHITEIDDKRINLDPDAEYIQTELGSVSYQNGRILILSAITSKVVQITPIKRNVKPIAERGRKSAARVSFSLCETPTQTNLKKRF